jgi:sugar lactone lactonase YvrE
MFGWRRIALIIGAAALLLTLGYVLLPSPTSAVAWAAPAIPERVGMLAPNTALDDARLIGVGLLHEPEDIAFGPDGLLYTGVRNGDILRAEVSGQGEPEFTVFANTGGNPLGMRFAPDGSLIVADALRGLLSFDANGEVTVLATEAAGQPLHFTNDLDIASDGTIYFSDASSRFDNVGANPVRDTMEGRPNGRLLAHDTATGETRVLLHDLYFANGVTLTQDESAVLVAELARYRITRYWLTGPQAGSSDVLIDNLPGLPDGIMSDDAGTIWASMGSPRTTTLDLMHTLPFMIDQMSKLPDDLLLAMTSGENHGLVLGISEQGEIMHALYDSQRIFNGGISNVVPHDGRLYLGTRYGRGQIGIVSQPGQ